MNTLYDYDRNEYSGTTFQNAAEEAITFNKEVLTQMLKDIYEGMNVQDEIHREAFYETLRIFNEASAEGISQASRLPSHMETFLEQLKTNNEVFSAFRVHRMQNDMAKLMIGNDGQLKSFEEWKKDIKGISDHYVDRWLKTEYSTAVLRAHQAADWIRFREETDVYPNLRWMPTTSPEPDQYHKQYWSAKLTLPVNHPFWKSHRPGDRWNCKCSLRQTDEPATTSLVADFKPIPAEPGLENNPADDGKLFNDTHPYITHAHDGAKEAVNKFLALQKIELALKNMVENVKTNYPKGEYCIVGELTTDVKNFLAEKGIIVIHDDIIMTDKQIAHALRSFKQKIGKNVTEEELINFPSYIDNCEIYWDEKMRNLQFITRQNGRLQKFIIVPNYKLKINGKTEYMNDFRTAGIVDETTYGMYKKIR